MDASKQSVNVDEVSKVQMVLDYMQTCFNMHLGLIDTKSLRSKTVYWAHRLMRENDSTTHHDLVDFLRNEMKLGLDTHIFTARAQSGKPLADGGYAQVRAFFLCVFDPMSAFAYSLGAFAYSQF